MKNLSVFRYSLAAALVLVLAWPGPCAADPKKGPERNSFVLFEYFTSVHCRRCLRAARVLEQVTAEQEEQGAACYLLSYHVEYLDTPGAKDPFSSLAFSQRHFRYAEAFKEPRAQAGEVIVNGKFAVPGEDAAKLRRAASRAVLLPLHTKLTLQLEPRDAGKTVKVKFSAAGFGKMPRDFFYFHAALVEDDIERAVETGPSAGQTVKEKNVVRSFDTLRFDPKSAQGSLDLLVPSSSSQGRSIIAFIQDPQTMQTVAAARMVLR